MLLITSGPAARAVCVARAARRCHCRIPPPRRPSTRLKRCAVAANGRVTLNRPGTMSILNAIADATTSVSSATTAPATGPSTAISPAVSDRLQLLVLLTMLVISITTAALCGCFRRRSIVGRNRIAPDEPVSALWMVFLFAAGFWFAVPMVYGMIVVILHPPDVPVATAPATGIDAVHVTAHELSPDETVWIGIVATVAGLAAALAGTALRRDGFARLGLTGRDLRRAIVPGVLGVIIVLPLIFAASEITEL